MVWLPVTIYVELPLGPLGSLYERCRTWKITDKASVCCVLQSVCVHTVNKRKSANPKFGARDDPPACPPLTTVRTYVPVPPHPRAHAASLTETEASAADALQMFSGLWMAAVGCCCPIVG